MMQTQTNSDEVREAFNSANQLLTTLYYLTRIRDEIASGPISPDLRKVFKKCLEQLNERVPRLGAKLFPVTKEFTTGALKIDTDLICAFGQYGVNSHELVFRIGSLILGNVVLALGGRPRSDGSGQVRTKILSRQNRSEVLQVLRPLNFVELHRLEALLSRELSFAVENLVNHSSCIESDVVTSHTGHANNTCSKRKGKSKGGRPLSTDPKDDKRVYDAWHTGSYESLKDLGKTMGKSKCDVERALDRHRKRPGYRRRRKNSR